MRDLHLLDPGQRSEYGDGGFPRRLRQAAARDARREPATGLAGRVAEHVRGQFVADTGRGLRCLAISGRRGDGISWAATQAAEAARAPHVRVLLVRSTAGAGTTPEIFRLLARRAILRAAGKSGLVLPGRLRRNSDGAQPVLQPHAGHSAGQVRAVRVSLS